MSKSNKYNAMSLLTVRYEMLKKACKDASSFAGVPKFFLGDLPAYFSQKKRKVGVISISFTSYAADPSGGYSFGDPSESEHVATFPAFLDDWGRVWVVLDGLSALRVTNDPDDMAWESFEQLIETVKKG